MHFSSSSLSSSLPRCLPSFSPSTYFSGARFTSFSFLWSSPLLFCAWQMFSSSRSLRTTRSKLKELKKARSVRDCIWSGLMARIWKLCSLCCMTLLFYGMSAILLWEALMVSRNSSSSYMVLMVLLIFSKSSLQLGLALISLITSSRCCTGTANPNFSKARCSMLPTPLINQLYQLNRRTNQKHIPITYHTAKINQINRTSTLIDLLMLINISRIDYYQLLLIPPYNYIRVIQMFPHSYTYNPGVVLDPVTMTPMITHGGNITVNPLGVPMRPQQKVWQKMFIKNIPQECTNEIMQRLLNEFGAIKNFKRALDNRGRLLPFCHFDLETGEEILRIRRLFQNIKILNNILEIKISPETENFIKEWTGMQKDEWRKKLAAPGMNQAKEYDTIEMYQIRDDKKYKQKIDQTLHQINIEVRRIAQEKAREQQRRQHPREKEREKARKKVLEDQDRNFNQKEDQLLRRQRQKQKEYRKEKEKEREREKARVRRLEKEIALDEDEIEARVARYLTEERRRQVQREQEEDEAVMEEENPPLPEEQIIAEQQAHARKVKVVAEEDIIIGEEKVEEVLVEAPKPKEQPEQTRPRQLQKHQLFQGYEKIYEQPAQKEFVQLNLPEVINQEMDQGEEQRRREAIKQLEKEVPQNKMDLWQFPIDWDKLSKSTVLERHIRPWLEEMSNEYMGGFEEKFIGLVEKKLLSRSHPDKIIKIMKHLLDDDSEDFVIKLWKKLVLEYLKLQNGLI